jgi:hypothetical protein
MDKINSTNTKLSETEVTSITDYNPPSPDPATPHHKIILKLVISENAICTSTPIFNPFSIMIENEMIIISVIIIKKSELWVSSNAFPN